MSVLEYIDSEIFTPVYNNKLPVVTSENVDNICKELYYAIKAEEPIFIYGDYDMDGFCAGQVWNEVLASLYRVPPIHFQYSRRMHTVDSDILRQVKNSRARIVIICDSGSGTSDRDVISILHMNGFTPIVIDHHNWEGDYEAACVYNLIFNSHEERDMFGGAEVSGAYASLLVAARLCEKYFSHTLSFNAMAYALASMYSDVVDLSSPPGRALYNVVSTTRMPGPQFFSSLNEWNYSFSKRFFSYIVSPKVNACFRTENFSPLNKALGLRDKYGMKSVVTEIKDVHSEASKLVDLFIPLFTREYFGDIVLCIHKADEQTKALHIRNFSGLIANKIAQEEKRITIVLVYDNRVYSGSFRDFYNRKLLPTFRLFCIADGHDSAFGVSVTNIKEFKRHLRSLSGFIETTVAKDYEVLSSSLAREQSDIQALALYNEYMNVRPRILLTHRCPYARLIKATKYKKTYDVGLPYTTISTLPLVEGSTILVEPTISKSVELRCVE